MSEHTLQCCHERHNESQESLHQSVWMAQRTRTSWNSAPVVPSSFAHYDRMVVRIVEPSKGTFLDADICAVNLPDARMCQQGDFDAASNFVNSAKTNRVHTSDEGAAIINEALVNSRNPCNAIPERRLLGQRVGTSEPDFTEQIFSSKDTWNQTGSISQNLAEWPLKSFAHLIEESDPNSSRITFKEQSIETNYISSEQDCCNSANCSTYLVCDKKKDKQPLARNSERIYGSLYSSQNDGALRINDFSTSKIYIPTSVENSTHEFSLTRLSPCHCSHTGDTKLEELNQRNTYLGVASYPSSKDFMVDKSPAKSQATVAFPREKVRSRKAETNPFDVKQDGSSHLAADDSIQNRALSRWVKRLKLGGASYSSSKMGDAESGNNCSSARPMLSRVLEEGQMKTDPWIRRWCHKGQRMKPRSHESFEPQSLKATMDKFKMKQLPSTAAMALMRKATNSIRPRETRKKGSVIVWKL